LFLIFYVSAVLATQIFGTHPDEDMQGLFGTIGRSMYTLFQIMTLEGWSENVAEPTMEFFPYAWAFFVPFIIITSFAVLNLFIGIIVDAMDIVKGLEEDDKEIKMAVKKEAKDLHRDIDKLRKEILEIKEIVKESN
jgi:voltage-gated sodium channel